MTLNNIKKLGDLKTDALDVHRTYPDSYLWVFIDGKLFGSSRSMEMYF